MSQDMIVFLVLDVRSDRDRALVKYSQYQSR